MLIGRPTVGETQRRAGLALAKVNGVRLGVAALSLPPPRWIEHVPLVLAYTGFVGLGMVSGRLGVAWTPIRATFAMPIDAVYHKFSGSRTVVVASAIQEKGND